MLVIRAEPRIYCCPVRMLQRLLGGGDETIARARRPEELAASRGRPALEGLDWLGRRPGARAPLLYRLLLSLGELVLFRIARITVTVEGREHLPRGGYIVAAAIHRGWIDPLVVLRALPREPRVWFVGSAATAFDKRWKERLLHRTGGLLPVWRGGGIDVHVSAARAVIDEGAVLCLFIEGGIVGPPARVWPGARAGAGLLALRVGAPIVPIAIIGSEELYRGRRIAVRILPATTPSELLGGAQLPEPDTRGELRSARAVVHAIAATIDDALPELAAAVYDPPGTERRWKGLTRLLR
jgi:1-acyl-sn-glycerol-3-phosphate acyltransferase